MAKYRPSMRPRGFYAGVGAGAAYAAKRVSVGFKKYRSKNPVQSAPKWRRKLPTRTVTREKREGKETGVLQWTHLKKASGYKPRVAVLNSRLMRAAQEAVVFGWRRVKNFDDHGAVPCFSQDVSSGAVMRQPLYTFLLNGINRPNATPVPARQLYYSQAAKKYAFTALNGLNPDGGENSVLEYIYDGVNTQMLGQRLYHDYTHVKMNLWGAKNKSVRWIVQVIQPLSDEVNPYHHPVDGYVGTVAAQAYEGFLKQLTYNPISRITHRGPKHFKVIKSMSFIISPSSTTDGDQDPQVKTIDWFMRFNRVTNYDKASMNISGEFTIDDIADFKNNTQEELKSSIPYSSVPRDTQNLILMVRCSDYSPANPSFTNTIHGSFDLDFKSKYIVVD